MTFAAFALAWTVAVGVFVIALLLGYRLPFGPPRTDAPCRSLTLFDSASIEA